MAESNVEGTSASESDQQDDESQEGSDDSSSNGEDQVEEGSEGSETEEGDEADEQSQSGEDDADSEEEETPEIAEPPRSARKPQKTVTAKKKEAPKPKGPVASTSGSATSKRTNIDPKKKAAAKGSNMQVHPGFKSMKTKDMIIAAVSELNDKKGSTYQGIKKYIREHFEVTDQKIKMVTKLLRTAGDDGWLWQVSGIGASSGSHFKLPPETKKAMSEAKKKDAAADTATKSNEKAKPKAKTSTKRKMEKPAASIAEKEVPAKKKKVATKATKKKAAAAPKKRTIKTTKA